MSVHIDDGCYSPAGSQDDGRFVDDPFESTSSASHRSGQEESRFRVSRLDSHADEDSGAMSANAETRNVERKLLSAGDCKEKTAQSSIGSIPGVFNRWWEEGPTAPWEPKCRPRVAAAPKPQKFFISSLEAPKALQHNTRTARGKKVPSDLFLFYDRAGRSDTPRTAWNDRRGPTASARIRKEWEIRHRAAAEAAARAPTLRGVLLGHRISPVMSASEARVAADSSGGVAAGRSTGTSEDQVAQPGKKGRLRAVEPGNLPPIHLNGKWLSRADGLAIGDIEGNQLVWAEDGSTSRLTYHDTGRVVSLVVDGEAHSGVLSADGRLLRWGDGDRWVREDDDMERLRPSTSTTMPGNDDLDCAAVWEQHGWTNRPASSSTSRALMGSRGTPKTPPLRSKGHLAFSSLFPFAR